MEHLIKKYKNDLFIDFDYIKHTVKESECRYR